MFVKFLSLGPTICCQCTMDPHDIIVRVIVDLYPLGGGGGGGGGKSGHSMEKIKKTWVLMNIRTCFCACNFVCLRSFVP